MSGINPADIPCPHQHFEAAVIVFRLDSEQGMRFVLEAKVQCGQCGEHFVFLGARAGLEIPARPDHGAVTVSPDRTELRAPICPETSLEALR